MLVLSRNLNESIVIDGRIVVTVTAVAGGRVRLAIDAPEEVVVHRREVFERAGAAPRRRAEEPRDVFCHAIG
jgi:carbon storage regulator